MLPKLLAGFQRLFFAANERQKRKTGKKMGRRDGEKEGRGRKGGEGREGKGASSGVVGTSLVCAGSEGRPKSTRTD